MCTVYSREAAAITSGVTRTPIYSRWAQFIDDGRVVFENSLESRRILLRESALWRIAQYVLLADNQIRRMKLRKIAQPDVAGCIGDQLLRHEAANLLIRNDLARRRQIVIELQARSRRRV